MTHCIETYKFGKMQLHHEKIKYGGKNIRKVDRPP